MLKLMVHLNTYTPGIKPVTDAVFSDVGVVKVALLGPLTCVHTPVPVTATFAGKVVDVFRQSSWSGPVTASVGPEEMIIVTSELLVHVLLVIVQRKT